jgi:hypothetical protein
VDGGDVVIADEDEGPTSPNCQAWFDPECSDEQCAIWAEGEDCETFASYMNLQCPGFYDKEEEIPYIPPPDFVPIKQNCVAREDRYCSDDFCDKWAAYGGCSNPRTYDYMWELCPRSCLDLDPEAEILVYTENC